MVIENTHLYFTIKACGYGEQVSVVWLVVLLVLAFGADRIRAANS